MLAFRPQSSFALVYGCAQVSSIACCFQEVAEDLVTMENLKHLKTLQRTKTQESLDILQH
jgi:hypothetical protein